MFDEKNVLAVYEEFSNCQRMTKFDFINAIKKLTAPEVVIVPKKKLIRISMSIINDMFSVDEELLLSKCRKKHLVKARMFFSYYLKSKGITYKEIGSILKKDHSTIIHQVNTFAKDYEYDENFKKEYDYFASVNV